MITRYTGYTQHGCTLSLHRGLPSRHLTLVVSLAAPVRIVGMPGGQAPAELSGFVGGMHTSSALIAQDAEQSGVHIDLHPLGVRNLLGLPSAELSGHVVGLAELDRPRLAELPERLHEAGSWPRRFAILDQTFRAESVQAPGPAPEIGWAWRRMLADGGTGAVATLAGEVGWSRRHFSERFRAELGLSPKQAARVLRFERACEALRARPDTDLAELAVACGFYDQPHLSNEWRALAGCTPGTWIAEELPNLQYEPRSPGEHSTT
ncbi:AraC family transcriptional regulator [Amycolatopsis antarctica]|uniref:AraC family transcriptional regulator n=1 Tax=Amycolatopsis antarctica TaxID=1854586 RepID=A0A263CVV4_9PSEU|nr:helix-turn-helix domain-containing protein [Amycolatopsis antarctica]OZM70272.1 AraC family transcriptional regulator [Amycolatopsis antarctica]